MIYFNQEVGKLLLRVEPIVFGGNTLHLSEKQDSGSKRLTAPPPKNGGMFVPRAATSRPRAGLGHARKPIVNKATGQASTPGPSSTQNGGAKNQDEFRKMLAGKS